jgi:hypothetical protein
MKLKTKKFAVTKVISHPDYPEVKITIRPFSIFSLNQIPSAPNIQDVKEYYNIFEYSVVSWVGISDENDKVLKCNSENKKFLFESDLIFALEVVKEAANLRNQIFSEEERKNLETSQDGETQVSEK